MPEGDTIHSAARRIGAALVGKEIEAIETPHPRHALDRWPERLAGRGVRAVDARGKHLFIRFEGNLTLHSHLRMTRPLADPAAGRALASRPPAARGSCCAPHEHEVVQFDGPVLELMTDSRTRFDRQLAALGPDLLGERFDERDFLRRLRADDQTRGIGDALLDQRTCAGIGNVWKSEGCFLARIDPWRPLARVSDDEALAIVRGIRPLMGLSVERGGRIVTYEPQRPGSRGDTRMWVFERPGLPCRVCDTPIRARGQGDDNRTTYWCPRCQA